MRLLTIKNMCRLQKIHIPYNCRPCKHSIKQHTNYNCQSINYFSKNISKKNKKHHNISFLLSLTHKILNSLYLISPTLSIISFHTHKKIIKQSLYSGLIMISDNIETQYKITVTTMILLLLPY